VPDRAVPPPRAQPAPRPPRRSAFGSFVRWMLALVALVLIAGVVAGGVILTTDKASGVHVTEVAGNTIERVTNKFEELIKTNTE
jgi:hypothetical protein